MRTSVLSAAFVPYMPAMPLTAVSGQRRARPPAGAWRVARYAGFGALGADAKSAVSGAASGAAAGAAIAGPYGAAIGAIWGAAQGLLTKNYLNVAQMNAAEQQEVSAFNQYRPIAGQVAGRDIGYPALNSVFHGAVHSNIFPINNEKQCFHEGCSTYPGNASWADQAMNGGSPDKNTIPDIVPQAISAGVLDPRQILTQYWIPAQNAKGNHWAVPSNSLGQQLLIDIIDAYVSDHVPNAPYFYAQPTNPVLAATPVQAAPSTSAAPATTGPKVYPVPGGYTDTGQLTASGHKIITAQGQYYEFNQFVNSLANMPQPTSVTSTTGAVPTGYADTGQRAPNGLELYQGPDKNFYTWDGSTVTFYMTAGGSTVAPGTQTSLNTSTPVVSTGGIDPNTQNLINQLIAQGQSQQAAFNAAMQQLAAQGQAMTPQLQQQVATAVNATPTGASMGGSNTIISLVGFGLLGLLFITAKPQLDYMQRGGRRR